MASFTEPALLQINFDNEPTLYPASSLAPSIADSNYSARWDTERVYQSSEPELKNKQQWTRCYAIYATILWIITAVTFCIPTKGEKLSHNADCPDTHHRPINWIICGVVVCVYHLTLLWVYTAIYRSMNIGILFFMHSVVDAELIYLSITRRYAFSFNQETQCLEAYYHKDDFLETLWQFAGWSIAAHVTLQWLFSCSRPCFNRSPRGQECYRCLGKCTVCLTVVCIIWILVVFGLISSELPSEMYDPHCKIGIFVVIACLSLAIVGIFPFPFCREVTRQMFASWICCCCCYRQNEYNWPVSKPYSETYGVEESMREKLMSHTWDHDDVPDLEADPPDINPVVDQQHYL